MSAVRRASYAVAVLLLAVFATAALAKGGPPDKAPGAHRSLRAPVTDQNFYFVMADRFQNGDTLNDNGGLEPGKHEGQSGFDPTAKGWYHGGDLAGLRSELDYIKGLGTTALWLTPSFKNKAVQDNNGFPSAGYHGYWITDFTQIDPHLGTNDDLRKLVDAAHERGIKVYFDIISNHTADVIRYQEGAAPNYISKDVYPFRDAAGKAFDDRDLAGGSTFPALLPTGQPDCPPAPDPQSFPYTPCVPAAEKDVKVPDWLNDVSLYHNRGNTTFAGENSQYGDFFGLDDLFTENPKVVDGMLDIYKTWIKDFRIDGFRMDTMKHVDDAFWQRFAPDIESYAKAQGIDDFYMFGEVAEDFSHELVSHYPVHDDVQGVLDFLFQVSARDFASKSLATDKLRDFFADDDWYTDGDSNVYNLPTFLGNHDRGRIGMFVRDDNGGASEDELLARDRLAHELMYFSRGNPVIYYGDEQGFTGAGGDQDARQDMFPSQDPEYFNADGKNDDIGSDVTPQADNFDPSHPLYREIRKLALLTQEHRALRDGAQQSRFSEATAGVYAFSRISRSRKHEYVVALNNAEHPASASIPTFVPDSKWEKVYGDGPQRLRSGSDKALDVTLAPLSTMVYRAKKHIPRSKAAPDVTVNAPDSGRDRLKVEAAVAGSSFYEVTFYAKAGDGSWQDIGTDDNAPYRVFHDVSDVKPGTPVQYRAVVLDNAGHSRASGTDTATVAPPSIVLEAPNEGQRVRGKVEVRALATPDHADYTVTFQRNVNGAGWEDRFTDDSSPVYTTFDDTAGLPDGAQVAYRAVLDYGDGEVISDTRTVTIVQTPVTQAVIHYKRADGNYAPWGMHLFNAGDPPAMAPGEATPAWELATAFEGSDGYGALHTIQVANDTSRIGFIVHGKFPNQDTKDPAGSPDRFFRPLATPEIWLRQDDVRIYSCEAADATCVVPSAQ